MIQSRNRRCAVFLLALASLTLPIEVPPMFGQCTEDGEPVENSCCAAYVMDEVVCDFDRKGVGPTPICDGDTAFPSAPQSGVKVEHDEVCAVDIASSNFSIYVLPDTQRGIAKNDTTDNSPSCFRHFVCQVEAIEHNLDAGVDNIQFVSHVGDIVHNQQSSDQPDWPLDGEQWYLASQALEPLVVTNTVDGNGIVPFALSLGNHDYDEWEDEDGDDILGDTGVLVVANCANSTELETTDCYDSLVDDFLYGGSDVELPTWHHATSPSGETTIQRFTPPDHGELLHVNLSYQAPDEELLWVRDRLDELPDHPTIVTTHSYLEPAKNERSFTVAQGGGVIQLTLPPYPAYRDCLHHTARDSGTNSGASIAEKLVELYPQIFLVLSGHKNGASLRTDTNYFGTDVYERVVDFQGMLNGDPRDQCGGDGWLDVVHFITTGAVPGLVFETASFSYEPLEPTSTQPREPTNLSGCRRCVEDFDLIDFRAGLESRSIERLAASADTYLDQEENDMPHGAEQDVLIRAPTAGSHARHGLLRFPQPVGPDAGQVIHRAILTLTLESSESPDTCDAHVLPMKAGPASAWGEDSTWDSFGSDGIVAGDEAFDSCSELDPDDCVVASFPSCADLYHPDAPGCLDPEEPAPTWITQSFDVTRSVEEWIANPSSLNGWAILPSPDCAAGEEFFFRSYEWENSTGDPVEVEQPLLSIMYRDAS